MEMAVRAKKDIFEINSPETTAKTANNESNGTNFFIEQ